MPRRIALALALLFAALTPAAAQPKKLSVAYVTAADLVTAFAAKDHGFFDQHGLDVTLIKMPIATAIPPALISGSLDIGMSTATILLQGAAGGLNLVAIEGISRFFANNPKVSLVAASGSGIKTAQDLVGRRVGVPGLNSVMDVTLRAWLMQQHVPVDKVTFVEANFPQMSDLLANHSLDAVAAIEPVRSRILQSGVGTNVANYESDLGSNILSALWIATRPWAEAHRDDITAFQAALHDAAAYLAANPDARKPLEIKYLGYPSPVAPSISLELAPQDFAFYQRIMQQQGLLDHPVNLDRLIFH